MNRYTNKRGKKKEKKRGEDKKKEKSKETMPESQSTTKKWARTYLVLVQVVVRCVDGVQMVVGWDGLDEDD